MATYYLNAGSIIEDGLTADTGCHNLQSFLAIVGDFHSGDILELVDNGIVDDSSAPLGYLSISSVTIQSYSGNVNKPTWRLPSQLYINNFALGSTVNDIVFYGSPSLLFMGDSAYNFNNVSGCTFNDVLLFFYAFEEAYNLNIVNNVFIGYGIYLEQTADCGLPWDGHGSIQYINVCNNDFYNIAGTAFEGTLYAYNTTFNINILNNIFHSIANKCVNFYVDGYDPVTFNIDLDYNCTYNFNVDWDLSGKGTPGPHNLNSTDPKFTNVLSGIFTLLAGSPCITSGIGNNLQPSVPVIDYNNGARSLTAPEIGAFNFNAKYFYDCLIGTMHDVAQANLFHCAVQIPPYGSYVTDGSCQLGWSQPHAPVWDGARSQFGNFVLASGVSNPPEPGYGSPGYTDYTTGLWGTIRTGIGAVSFDFGDSSPRYWVSPVSSNWNNTANWDETRGGQGGFSVPDSDTTVYFDPVDFQGIGSCTIDIPVNIASLYVRNSYDSSIIENNQEMTITTLAHFDGGVFIGDSSSVHTGTVYLGSGYVQDATIHISQDMSCVASHHQWSPRNNSNLILDGAGQQAVYVENGGIVPTLTVYKSDSTQVMCTGNSNPIIIKDDLLILDGTFNTSGVDLQVGL